MSMSYWKWCRIFEYVNEYPISKRFIRLCDGELLRIQIQINSLELLLQIQDWFGNQLQGAKYMIMMIQASESLAKRNINQRAAHILCSCKLSLYINTHLGILALWSRLHASISQAPNSSLESKVFYMIRFSGSIQLEFCSKCARDISNSNIQN